jgi:Zn-finger protein
MKKRKSYHEVWKERTFGAWYLPCDKEEMSRYVKRKYTNLWVCNQCNNVHSWCGWSKVLYLHKSLPKLQNKKTCRKCEGQVVTTVYM